MEYAKPVMRISELKKMGFSESFLMYVFRSNNKHVAWRSGTARNSPILFDTLEFEKIRRAKASDFSKLHRIRPK